MKKFQKKFQRKSKYTFSVQLFSIFYLFLSRVIYDINVEGKFCRAGQAAYENTMHAHSMLDT